MSTIAVRRTYITYGTPTSSDSDRLLSSGERVAFSASVRVDWLFTYFGNGGGEGTAPTLRERQTAPLPEAVEADLSRLAQLPDNWDGAGTAALNESTINRTRLLLGLVFIYGGEHLPFPFLSSAHDGSVILEWETETGNELIIDVPSSPAAPIRFLLVEPTMSGVESEIESEISDIWSIQAIVQRLKGNQRVESSWALGATGGSRPMSVS